MVAGSRTGMPVHDTVNHISALAQNDRLRFERCEVVGDKIVAPHPNESDGRPSFLTVPALRKRRRRANVACRIPCRMNSPCGRGRPGGYWASRQHNPFT